MDSPFRERNVKRIEEGQGKGEIRFEGGKWSAEGILLVFQILKVQCFEKWPFPPGRKSFSNLFKRFEDTECAHAFTCLENGPTSSTFPIFRERE